jgi:DNA-binding transcriptional LysR family regulator
VRPYRSSIGKLTADAGEMWTSPFGGSLSSAGYSYKFVLWYTLCSFDIQLRGENVARSLNFRQIEAFRALMTTGTTTASAKMLNTTQPSISRLLSQIQSTTGLRLFELSHGRLNPTPEANKLYEAVQQHFVGIEKIEQTIALIRRSGTGFLRIGATPVLGMGVLPRIIPEFRRQYEGVDISLHTIPSRQLREGLLSGLYDVGLTTTSFHFSRDEFEAQVLDEGRAVCVMSKNHELAARRRIEPADFARNTLLTLESGDDLTDAWRGILAKNDIVPVSVIETTYSATICALAEAGMGIGVVSPYATAIMADRVHASPLTPAVPVKAFLLFPRNLVKSALAVAFGQMAKGYFAVTDRRAKKPPAAVPKGTGEIARKISRDPGLAS